MRRGEFGPLYDANYGRVLCFLLARTHHQQEAEDLTSRAFLLAYDAFGKWRRRCAFQTWVIAIALNELRNSKRRRTMESLEALAEQESPVIPKATITHDTTERDMERRDLHNAILRALKCVPHKMRHVLTAHYVADRPIKAIARECRVPSGTVCSRLSYAREKFASAYRRVDPMNAGSKK